MTDTEKKLIMVFKTLGTEGAAFLSFYIQKYGPLSTEVSEEIKKIMEEGGKHDCNL